MTRILSSDISRRTFLKRGTAASGAVLFAPAIARAQGTRLRRNLMSPDAAGDLKSYGDAVAAMLQLPADDPRNWYRIAFIHFLDCPHGNWWFTSWHRGYLGYFEQLCREMSGNPDFMLPYWDWTADPYVPPALFGADNPLDPVNYRVVNARGYIPDFATFNDRLRDPMEAFWNAFTPAQMAEQAKRMNPNFDYFWSDPNNGALGSFQQIAHARFLTAANVQLDVNAQPLVATARLNADLAPSDFAGAGITFENPVTASHQGYAGFSLLSGTHNIVHMSIGGYFMPATKSYAPPFGLMSQNLSPIDPIFFLHHCNIDRLWDVWNRKQLAAGRSAQPADDLLASYKPEPYLFFVNAKGHAVTDRTTAWDYFEIGGFDYSYEPGSGEDQVAAPVVALALQRNVATANVLATAAATGTAAATARFVVPKALVASARETDETSRAFATVSFVPPADALGKIFQLFLSPEGVTADLDPEGPDFAGSFAFFGHPHHMGLPVTFTVPIGAALDRLFANGTLKGGAPFGFSLVVAGSSTPINAEVSPGGQLRGVEVHVLSAP